MIRALDFSNQVIRRRAVTFLISDFQISKNPAAAAGADQTGKTTMDDLRHALQLTNKRHDLIALTINDLRERELPAIGLLTIEDAETGEQFELDTSSAKVRARFAEWTETQRGALRQIIRAAGVDLLDLNTNEPYLPALLQFFATRERRRR